MSTSKHEITYQPVVTTSVSRQIAEQIRGSIIDGRLKAEDRLPTEQQLAQQFNVSRPTVREALKRLAAQNLIRSRRGPAGGTFVNRPSQEEVRSNLTTAATLLVSLGEFSLSDIAEARLELECMCGRLAAEHRQGEHVERMAAEIALQKSAALSDEEFCASDVRFHRALVDATANPVLQFVMFAVIEALQPVENMVVFRFRERAEVVAQHERILAAISDRDIEATQAAVKDQMVYLIEKFAEAQAWQRERAADPG